MKYNRKQYFSFAVFLFLLVAIPITVRLAQTPQKAKQAASDQQPLENSFEEKGEYVPGEVIVKLKEHIEELSQSVSTDETNQQNVPLEFGKLNQQRTPRALQKIHTKYRIKTVEKVIKNAESPEKELSKLKQKFSDEINTNQRVIDEQKILSVDLSRIYKLSVDSTSSVEQIVQELSQDPAVEYAEPNYIAQHDFTPNDPFFPVIPAANNQWGLENPGRVGFLAYVVDSDIDASAAWDIQKGSPLVIVAVLDAGIIYTYPDLGGGIGATYKVVGGYDFVNEDPDPMDDNGHGTHVAGIIAASMNNAIGIAGTCPNCKLMAVKVCRMDGYCYSSDTIPGIYYAVNNGAKVVNASWGGAGFNQSMQDAINYAAANNVVVVASAGNNNTSVKHYPAAMNNVIAVAATQENDTKFNPSNYDDGTGWVDIAAPGSNILSTYLEVPVSCLPHETSLSGYAYCSGTSMAAPFVAGVAGLLLSQNPSWTSNMVTQQLKSSADNINAKNPGYENKLGAGRLNAHKALSVGVFNLLSPINNVFIKTANAALSWSAASGASSYTWQIYQANNSLYKSGTVTTTSVSVPLPAGKYLWRVTAKNAASSKQSSFAEFSIPIYKIKPLSTTQILYGTTQSFEWRPLHPLYTQFYFIIYNSANAPIYYKLIQSHMVEYTSGKLSLLLSSATNAGFVKGKSYTWQLIVSNGTGFTPPTDSTGTPQSFVLQ